MSVVIELSLFVTFFFLSRSIVELGLATLFLDFFYPLLSLFLL